jgi:hypothetical protein
MQGRAKWNTILRNDPITWQGHETHRLGEMGMDGNNRMQPPVGQSLGCSSVLVGIVRANGAVQIRSICVSDSLDGRVADRDLLCRSLQAHCTRDFTAGAQDAIQDDNCFCPSPYPVMNDELYRLSSGG